MPDAIQDGPTVVGRYVLEGEVASGGMATVYYGRPTDEPPGTIVAIKRVHPHLAKDKRFASMFIDEARLVSRIHHPNVIRTLDIIANDSECLLVMEYVQGESLSRLLRLAQEQRRPLPLDVVSSIVGGALDGLQAAHEATNAAGAPLLIVHRDISPQNIMVGADGMTRVLDFGVAKAAGSLHVTRDGEIKGKLAYMSPEQISAGALDRRTDVYAAGVVLWEAVTQQPLFDGDSEAAIIAAVLRQEIPVPSSLVAGVPPELDALILRSLAAKRGDRFGSAAEMARALDAVVPRADVRVVAAWVDGLAGDALRARYATMQTGGSATRHGERHTAVSEVFLTSAESPAGKARGLARPESADGGMTSHAPLAADAAPSALAAIERGATLIDHRVRDATRYLPLLVQKPADKLRWWIVGSALALLVGVIAWALKPGPPPPSGVVAAPIE